MTHSDIPRQTSPLYNVQPTSNTSEKRIFPSLPYTSENVKFSNKFNFQFSDLTDTEYITLCNMLLKYKTCYATTLVKYQLLFVLDSNLMHNLLHNVLLKFQFIRETNSMPFLKS